jgi:hypothetical protein
MEELKKLVDEISRHGPPKQALARVISINGNALLSYREGNTLTEEVLSGSDPTRFRIGGVDFELLHLSLSTGGPALAEDVRNSLVLYFRAKPKVSLSSTLAAFHRFASVVKIGNLDVLVRPDAWFLEYDDYPFFPAFVVGLEPPNAIRYELSSYVTCGSSAIHGMTCSGKNFKP